MWPAQYHNDGRRNLPLLPHLRLPPPLPLPLSPGKEDLEEAEEEDYKISMQSP